MSRTAAARRIPWRLKSTAFSIIDVVGETPLYLAQKYITRRSCATADTCTILDAWRFHENNIRACEGREILEFGAGKDLRQNLYLSTLGVRQTVVDLHPMIDLDLVNRAITSLASRGLVNQGHVRSLNELRDIYQIDYRAPVDLQVYPAQDRPFDICLSTDTLEHIPAPVIRGIWQNCRNLLRDGGYISSAIDYSDHYSHSDDSISPINFLRYTERQWRRFNHNCHYQNRLRHQHYLDIFRQGGFGIVFESTNAPQVQDAFILRDNLTGHPSDFSTYGFILAKV